MFIRSLPEDVADKRLDVTSRYFSVFLRLFWQKGLTVDLEKSPGLGLFGKSGAGKQQRFCFSWLTPGRWPQVYLVDGKNELQALSNVLQRARPEP